MSWDPFRDLRKMREKMEKMFRELESETLPQIQSQKRSSTPSSPSKPFTDVREKDGDVVVTMDLPGVSKEDISISIDGRDLIVSAEKSAEKEERDEEKGYIKRERGAGKIGRKVRLPSNVDEEEAKATFQNGVLEVTLPKVEKVEEGKQIEIE